MEQEHFIDFLKRHCAERIKGEPAFFERDHGRDEAYRDIISFINLYQKDYANGQDATSRIAS